MKTANQAELATILGAHRTSITRRATKENWPFDYAPVKGGREKRFTIRLLPEEIRIAVAKHRAAAAITPSSPAAAAGAEAATELVRAKAADVEETRIAKEQQLAAFHRYPAEQQAVAQARRDLLRARDAYQAASGSKNVNQNIAEFCRLYNQGDLRMPEAVRAAVPKLSRSSLNRWHKALQDHGLPGLVNGYRNPNKGQTSLSPEHQDFVVAMIIKSPGSTINTITAAMETRFARVPHASSIRRFLKGWMARNASRYLYITNPDAWKNQHMFAVGDASEQVIRLNQLWEFDSTPADVMLVDGRYNIIGVIDVFSRRLKLQVSKTSKATAVAALIRRAIIDWGVPEIAKTDNGADYVSNHIVQVFEGLEIEQQLCPPFTPEAKPHIERSFRTFSHGITTLLPGFIGHNVADRKAIEARRSFADRLMKRGDTVELTMTAEELQTLCNRWTEAMYHHNQHHGLNNRTPAQVARNYQGTERRISDERALDILLAEAPRGDGKRTVSKDGIKVNNIKYFSEQFDSLAGEQVRVKLDATDLGTIYLFDADWNFLCTAHDPLRKGLNRAEEAAKLKKRQDKLMREGRKELTKLVRKQALDDIHNEILEHRESQIANIIEMPKASEPYNTPALEEAGKAARAILADQREERAMDELTADITIEAEPEPKPGAVKKGAPKVVPIFSSAGEQYNFIKTRERTGPLSEREAEWLAEFYETRSGRMYLELEGDLREKIGLPEHHLAEA